LLETILLLALIPYLGINLFLSKKLYASVDYAPKQKLFQSILIWILPFIGAWLVNSELKKLRKHEENFYKEFTNRNT